MKKLIPAIGMTLLGAALLGTSTYAWFSANKTVTATGMNLQAKADSSLLISNAVDGTYSNTVLLENDVASANTYLNPVEETFSEGAYTFKKLTEEGKAFVDDAGVFHAPESKTIADYLEATAVDNYHDSVWLKFEASVAEGGAAPTQVVNVAATMSSEGTEEIYKAFHVVLVNTASKAVIEDFTFSSLGTKVSGTGSITLTANTPSQVEVYGYLEGDNAACKNSNAINGAAYTVNLEFTIPAA
ncbi:MAG: hypothetical protein MJ222_03415 [Bacilli bacterium]|nr:hypothetical protein [Bacilli bacterium]